MEPTFFRKRHLSFQPFRIQDKSLFQSFMQGNGRICDHTFANLFAWQQTFGNQWAEYNGHLIVRSRTSAHNEHSKYMILPNILSPNLSEIMHLIEADAGTREFSLVQLSPVETQHLEQQYPGQFMFDTSRDMSDYLYYIKDFNTFQGRKLAAKRNHVNKFKSLYSFHYKTLTPGLFEQCMQLERTWRYEQHGDTTQLEEEENAIRLFFDNYEDLELTGGTLFVKNELVAFTFGSPINEDTFDIHIEKADTRYEGVFPMISQLFAQHLSPQYQYVNREEDLGLAGLRQSKLSYHPLRLEQKFSARPLTDELRDIIRLWRDCFHDETSFLHSVLSRFYNKSRMIVRKSDSQIVSSCLLIPCDSPIGKIGYLYAISTAERHRRQGLAAQVTQEAIVHARNQGMSAVALIPADEGLQQYYAQFGFEPHPYPIRFANDCDLGTGDPTKDHPMFLNFKDKPIPAIELVCTPDGV
ncbi:MAG: GNAT family N-acetyltransferase [Bacteroidales bacterium]|nr:GNAT family N-acetyltransferase [Bacteroidales bacterium]